ncbi:hypothetical protein HMPREF9075_00871 [Capnocytophaga sp. oral taxon 332 str. F0381]|nr:hypothetical protein HMPREF9075_00871 [Capnocytophaga sp. oral taxon 332 str. F0381]
MAQRHFYSSYLNNNKKLSCLKKVGLFKTAFLLLILLLKTLK